MSSSNAAAIRAAIRRAQAQQKAAIDEYNRKVRAYNSAARQYNDSVRRLQQQIRRIGR
jgi:hypothetical protein